MRSSGFVADQERMAGRIGEVPKEDPARAVGLFETFLAGCYGKAEEIDDSDGEFGFGREHRHAKLPACTGPGSSRPPEPRRRAAIRP